MTRAEVTRAQVTRPQVTRAHAITTVGLVHIYRSEGHDVAALSGVCLLYTSRCV